MASTKLDILLTLNHIPMIDLREIEIPTGIIWCDQLTGIYLDEEDNKPLEKEPGYAGLADYIITNIHHEKNIVYGDLDIIDTPDGRILYNDIAIYNIPVTFEPNIVNINNEVSALARITIRRKGKHQDINVDNT